jgi:hypothetical protein
MREGILTTILTLQDVRLKDQHVELQTKIHSITQYNSKPYFRQALKRLAALNADNANVICDYILAEQTDINIKRVDQRRQNKSIDMVIKLLGQQALIIKITFKGPSFSIAKNIYYEMLARYQTF